jgi:hypothetical protein
MPHGLLLQFKYLLIKTSKGYEFKGFSNTTDRPPSKR